MTHTDISDVAAELGVDNPTATAQMAQWRRWIARVESAIRARFPGHDARLSADAGYADLVRDVVGAVVARKVENPRGLTSTTVSIDDGSMTERRDGVRAGMDPLDLTPGEWSLLEPAPLPDAFSTRVRYEPGWRR